MNKEDWKELEQSFSTHIGHLEKLKIDGYNISIQTQRGKNKIYYMVWVNGKMEGKNLKLENEICKRFYFVKTKNLYTAKEKARYIKLLGKRGAKKLNLDKKLYFPSAHFTSFSSLKNKFIKNNESIEWIRK